MNCKITHSVKQEAKTKDDEYLNTLKINLPQMASLFDNLSAGVTPNFLDMMSVISEMVDYYTNCDTADEQFEMFLQNMSSKNCRFCS